MSNTYRINFKQLRQENLKEIFESFERAFTMLGIDFYLIGALARDTWFAQKGIRALGTKDIDWAVAVTERSQFQALKDYLINKEGFTGSSSNEYVVFDKNGYQVDLLPFGALEIEAAKFVDSQGVVRTDITGYKEVFDEAVEEVNFENKFSFKVSSLPGIVILKLIAFDDRPEMRTNDIRDIGIILDHYFDIETEAIYSKHADLFDEERELQAVASRVMGREMQPILNRNAALKERVLSILYKNIQMLTQSPIGLILVGTLNASPGSVEEAVDLLKEIVAGIHDKRDVQNEYLEQVAYFRDVTGANFEMAINKPIYPSSPHSIYSKNFTRIQLTGQSTFHFHIIFFKVTGDIVSKYITPYPPGTPNINVDLEIPLEECQVRFELAGHDEFFKEKYCKLSFELHNL